MRRGRGKRLLIGMVALGMVCVAQQGTAQDTAPAPAVPGMPAGDVVAREIKPQFETMGLIWIQEGNVKRLAYVVQTGDTMWDIAARYLNSPYYWPKIWERNTYVINPHLIFPGDILYIYPEGIAETPATQPGSTVTSIQSIYGGPKKQQVVYQKPGSTGFVSTEEIDSAGSIIENADKKALLGQDDTVYVDVGKEDRVIPGDRYSIFRITTSPITGKRVQIKHPITGETIGYQVSNLGELTITKVEPGASEARIDNSYVEIHNGDLITPYISPLEEKVDVVESGVEIIKGYIIANKNLVKLLGEEDIVYLDLGADDGVTRGNIFEVYMPCELVHDNLSGKTIRLPEKIIGHLVVLEALEKTSVALVLDSRQELAIGDRVLMSKYSSWEIEGVSQPTEIENCQNDPTCRLITAQEYQQGKDIPYCEAPAKREAKPKNKSK
jgi:hypothetical protein